MEPLYSTKVTATGGRYGHINSEDNSFNAERRISNEMGDTSEAFLNPETLFAAGFAASFNDALNVVILREKVRAGKTNTTAEVSVFKYGAGYKFNVQLEVEIPGVNTVNAQDLVEKAHHVSPYTYATRGNVEVKVIIKKKAVVEDYRYF